MKSFSNIDNVFIYKHKLSLQEGYLLDWMLKLPSWAKHAVIDNEVFYFADKSKACMDIPVLTEKIDTMYRYYKRLETKGFIKLTKRHGQDFIKILPKCDSWKFEKIDNKIAMK